MKGYIQEVIQTFIYSGPYNGGGGGLGKVGLKNTGMRKMKRLPLLLSSYNPLWVSDFSIRSYQADLSNTTFVQFFTPITLISFRTSFRHEKLNVTESNLVQEYITEFCSNLFHSLGNVTSTDIK